MRSRAIGKFRSMFGICYEKIMEWLYLLKERTIPKKRERKRLTEQYIIYEQYAASGFVRDFINERMRNTMLNRYSIEVETGSRGTGAGTDDATEEIGKVRLMRRKELIDEATLIIKKGENNIIYWKFNK